MEGPVHFTVNCIDIGSVLEQQLYDLRTLVEGGSPQERRATLLVNLVHVDFCRYQFQANVVVLLDASESQSSFSVCIFNARIGPEVEQQLHNVEVVFHGSLH